MPQIKVYALFAFLKKIAATRRFYSLSLSPILSLSHTHAQTRKPFYRSALSGQLLGCVDLCFSGHSKQAAINIRLQMFFFFIKIFTLRTILIQCGFMQTESINVGVNIFSDRILTRFWDWTADWAVTMIII